MIDDFVAFVKDLIVTAIIYKGLDDICSTIFI
jgi:hypothetical protein